MIALALAAQIVAAPHLIAVPPAAQPESCPKDQVQMTGWERGPAIANGAVRPQTLNKLPRANHEIAITRMIDGCPAPVVVRYAVGK